MSANHRQTRLQFDTLEDRLVPTVTDYVRQLYADVLRRSPADSELNSWVQQLSGGRSAQSVAQAFILSDENHKLQVDATYVRDLGRSVDPASEAQWISVMRNGVTILDVERTIFVSQEYQNSHLSDLAYINGVYQAVLGRAADSAGSQSWQVALASGQTRDNVARRIQFSTENLAQDVNAYYTNYLRRLATDSDRIYWVNQVQSGQQTPDQVAAAFLSSTEYRTRYGF